MDIDGLYYSSTATSLPARHFPAFAAADRVGGGFRQVRQLCCGRFKRNDIYKCTMDATLGWLPFPAPAAEHQTAPAWQCPASTHVSSTPCWLLSSTYWHQSDNWCRVYRVEGRHSNAAYNRHLANSKPRAAPAALCAQTHSTRSCRNSSSSSSSTISLSPEHVNAAAQAGLAQAAALADRVTLKSGTWDHVLCSSNSSSYPSHAAALDTADTCTTSYAANDGGISSMPATYCRSQVLQHSLWLHDGTNFTSGHMQQVSGGVLQSIKLVRLVEHDMLLFILRRCHCKCSKVAPTKLCAREGVLGCCCVC
jgi:hypothetical protein